VPEHRATDVLRAVHQIHRRIARERDPAALLHSAVDLLVEALGDAACCLAQTTGDAVVATFEGGEPARLQRVRERLASGRHAAAAPGELTLSLACDTRVHGVLLLEAAVDWTAASEARALLEEVGEDLAFALCKIERLAEASAQAARLLESEQTYRMLTESVSDVIWVLDVDTWRFVFVSPSVERLRGYTVAEVLAQAPNDAMTERTAEQIARVLPGRVQEFLAGVENVYVDPIDQPRKDGSIVRTESVTRLLRDPATGHVHAYGVSRDLSERDRAHALEEQVTRIAESVPGLMLSFKVRPDGTTCIPFATAAALDVYGIAPERLVDDAGAWAANVHPDDLGPLVEHATRQARAMAPWHEEYRYLHPTKGMRWLEVWSSPLRDADGGYLWHGFVMDVTERRRSVARIERLSRLYRALSDTNEAIAQIGDEDALFQRVCDIVLTLGDVQVASVATFDPARGALVWRAGAGPATIGVEVPRELSVDRSEAAGRSMLAEAFRSGRVLIEDDFAAAPALAYWHAQPITAGMRAAVALPLRRKGSVIGAFSIGTKERGYFDGEVVELIETMAGNLALGLDHTARERELRESEERFRQIFELAPVGVAWIDSKSGRFIRVNRRYSEILGRPREEILAKSWQELTHPEHLQGDLDAHNAMLAGGPPGYAREKRYVREDGTEVWADLSVTRAWRDGEAPTFHVAVVEDITARKRAEFALRSSEERYRTLLDSLGDVVFTTSLDGVLTFTSRAIERFGWAPDQLVGTPLAAVIHPDDLPALLRARALGLAGHPGGPLEYRVIDATGKTRHVRSSSQPLVENGRVVGMYGVLVDLTHQRETEEHLRFAQKMEAVGRLAGGVAHDFNNLLSVIESYAELALEAVPVGDPVREDLGEIRAAAKRAESLTRQLLTFSRKQVLKPERLDLNLLVTRVEKMLGRVLGEDVELAFAPRAEPAIVEADPGQLEQVLMNLAINARDAMLDGGRLAIATANADFEPRRHGSEPPSVRPGAYVKLIVSDTGHGMTDEIRSRIFEPFFTTKAPGKGTGLGLAMVYGIVQQSGGHIAVQSAPNAGTTFEILLPAMGGADTRTSSAPPAMPASRGAETVLIVEDEPSVRTIALRILKAAGYHVLIAENGAEALLLCARHEGEIELMVTDVVMPGMNGKQLAERLALTRPATKVLFMSGYADDALGDRGVRSGSGQLLDKPFTSEALKRKVRSMLDGD
jgi:PAS domain S-box-containing protein